MVSTAGGDGPQGDGEVGPRLKELGQADARVDEERRRLHAIARGA